MAGGLGFPFEVARPSSGSVTGFRKVAFRNYREDPIEDVTMMKLHRVHGDPKKKNPPGRRRRRTSSHWRLDPGAWSEDKVP
jgi:hypothetical protein